ncbi:hypothetical protein [Candidatus Hecatella orcuttiae]|uniref:hypothetical protein n=1 Tax=Candidatus Hecatella orcuttiae TaxID=1935119 RepID=UPI0028680048|nr:hypothetical protein [Candidatus Hecatella orcuttiae]
MERREERRRAAKASAEALKGYDPLQVVSDLSDYALSLAEAGIRQQNPNMSEEQVREELRRLAEWSSPSAWRGKAGQARRGGQFSFGDQP